MDLKVSKASEEHQGMGWVLDYHQLVDIQQKLVENNFSADLETIEAVLLATANKEHLINS